MIRLSVIGILFLLPIITIVVAALCIWKALFAPGEGIAAWNRWCDHAKCPR